MRVGVCGEGPAFGDRQIGDRHNLRARHPHTAYHHRATSRTRGISVAYDIIGLQICDMPINAVGDMEVTGVANITRITDIIMPAFLFTAACIQGAMQPLDQTFRRRLRTQISAHHRDERPLLRIATGFGIETLMPTVTRGFNAFGIAVLA